MSLDLDQRRAKNQDQIAAFVKQGALLLLSPLLGVALVLGLVTRNPLLFLVVLVIPYAAVAFVAWSSVKGYDQKLLSSLGATPADEHAHARLHNLAEGLGIAHGLPKPQLLLLPGEGWNACTVPVPGAEPNQVAVVLSGAYVEALSRIELEGLLAQRLAHVRNGDVALGTFVAAVGSIPAIGGLLAPRAAAALDADLEQLADVAAVQMTRYPPGLAGALARLEGVPTAVSAATPLTAHLWLADPLPAGGAEPFVPHPPLADRVAMLREL